MNLKPNNNRLSSLVKLLSAVLLIINVVSGRAAVWTSAGNGQWTSASSWSLVSGAPAAAYPTANDEVTITTHTITVSTTSSCLSINIQSTGCVTVSSGYALVVYGPFTNAGRLAASGAGGAIIYFTTSTTFPSPTVTHTGTIAGTFVFRFRPYGRTINISPSTTFTVTQMICDGAGGTVINNGNITANSVFQLDAGVTFTNAANAQLTLLCNITYLSGTFNPTGNPNTVTYTGSGWNTVLPATYHHLRLFNTGTTTATKALGGNIVTNGNFIIASNVQLNCNNRDITCSGMWFHGSTNNLTNIGGTFTFAGTNPNIVRVNVPEILGNVVINCSGTMGMNATNLASYTGSFRCANLTLQSGTLDLNATGNYTVSITGNLNNTGGSINPRNGLFNFIGSAAQTIGGNTMTFSNMRVANTAGVSTTSAQNLTGTLTVASGSFTSNMADFTLVSDATTGITARIAPLTTGSVAGSRWVVQRRVLTSGSSSANPYWGDYSSPVSGTTLADWDSEMYLSGVGGDDGTACCPTFYSVKQWNNGGGNYSDVTSLIPLATGIGYSIWTASDLSSLSPFTFDTRGTPNTGTITIGSMASDYYLVGNPYPSQISFGLLTRTSVANYFWILDEILQDYAFWDGATASGTGKLSGSGGVINSSQGFMVESTGGGSGSLRFTESSKATANVAYVRQALPGNLVKFNFTKDGQRVGMENMIHFVDGANNTKDELDVPYLKAPFLQKRYEAKMLTLNGDALSKNTLNLADMKQDIPVVFKPAEAGSFSINFEGLKSMDAYTCIMLEDKSTGTFTDLSNTASYSFTCSDNSERHFVLHFTKGRESISCVKKSDVFDIVSTNEAIAERVFAGDNNISVVLNNPDVRTTEVIVYNSVGQLVHTEQYVGGGQFTMKRPAGAGIYFVILSRDGVKETHKVALD